MNLYGGVLSEIATATQKHAQSFPMSLGELMKSSFWADLKRRPISQMPVSASPSGQGITNGHQWLEKAAEVCDSVSVHASSFRSMEEMYQQANRKYHYINNQWNRDPGEHAAARDSWNSLWTSTWDKATVLTPAITEWRTNWEAHGPVLFDVVHDVPQLYLAYKLIWGMREEWALLRQCVSRRTLDYSGLGWVEDCTSRFIDKLDEACTRLGFVAPKTHDDLATTMPLGEPMNVDQGTSSDEPMPQASPKAPTAPKAAPPPAPQSRPPPPPKSGPPRRENTPFERASADQSSSSASGAGPSVDPPPGQCTTRTKG
jgi:hypothetical protein